MRRGSRESTGSISCCVVLDDRRGGAESAVAPHRTPPTGTPVPVAGVRPSAPARACISSPGGLTLLLDSRTNLHTLYTNTAANRCRPHTRSSHGGRAVTAACLRQCLRYPARSTTTATAPGHRPISPPSARVAAAAAAARANVTPRAPTLRRLPALLLGGAGSADDSAPPTRAAGCRAALHSYVLPSHHPASCPHASPPPQHWPTTKVPTLPPPRWRRPPLICVKTSSSSPSSMSSCAGGRRWR